MILFCIVVHLIALHLQVIQSGIKNQMICCQFVRNSWLLDSQRYQLNVRLKKYHFEVSKTISLVNKYFGFPLLVEVVYVFIGVITSFMFLFLAAIEGDRLLIVVNSAFVFVVSMHLILIGYYSDKISIEVFLPALFASKRD